ncbi:MAG: hypothetical protein V2G42_07030 [bacterium JZ-2024 1]
MNPDPVVSAHPVPAPHTREHALPRAPRPPAKRGISWNSLLESALSGDPTESLSDLAQRAGTTVTALVQAISDPSKRDALDLASEAVLHLLRTLLAIRLLRRAIESEDLAVAKLVLSHSPPPATPPSLPVSWQDLLTAIPGHAVPPEGPRDESSP